MVVGLALGIFISAILNLPNVIMPTQTGAGMSNQVQVSGKVQVTQSGTVRFRNLNRTIDTSVPIANGEYSILLLGGDSYDVYVYWEGRLQYSYWLYVPSGVTTFTADF